MVSHDYDDRLVIVTEDACGNPYCIESQYIMDVLDDWNGACLMCPANGARVFLAIYNSKPINPHLYTDWESLMQHLKGMVCR